MRFAEWSRLVCRGFRAVFAVDNAIELLTTDMSTCFDLYAVLCCPFAWMYLLCCAVLCCAVLCCAAHVVGSVRCPALPFSELRCWVCRDAMAVFAMEAASIISERSLEISFASALSTVSASGLNVNAGERCCWPFKLHNNYSRPLPCICSPFALRNSCGRPLPCTCSPFALRNSCGRPPCICFLLVLTWLTAGGSLQWAYSTLLKRSHTC